jgi:hypothetical protein
VYALLFGFPSGQGREQHAVDVAEQLATPLAAPAVPAQPGMPQ